MDNQDIKIQNNVDFKTLEKNGGRITNSPPPNVSSWSPGEVRALASNVDTLALAVDVNWEDSVFFEFLAEKKDSAKKNGKEIPVTLSNAFKDNEFLFNLKSHGSNGYEWLLYNHEFALMVGNWIKPISRPSVMMSIRSETLWRLGVKKSIQMILDYLVSAGGKISTIKLSRVDLCVDVIMPEACWSLEILNYSVSRCNKIAAYMGNKIEKLQTIEIGTRKSPIMARLYDKPLEIIEKSNKEWMYDVWKLEQVPDGSKIIRIEFQLRREVLKQLNLNSHIDLFKYYGNAWAYCTKEWLNFKDNPGKHQTNQRRTLSWWEVVQNGFMKMQNPEPLIRFRASDSDEERLIAQTFGYLSSIQALGIETTGDNADLKSSFENVVFHFPFKAKEFGKGQQDFVDAVNEKRAKYVRTQAKLKTVIKRRKDFFGMNAN